MLKTGKNEHLEEGLTKGNEHSSIDNNLLNLYLTIGANIRRLRGRMSQRELAKKSKVSRTTILNSENGKPISLEKLQQIADALDVPIADFFITDEQRGDISYVHIKLMEKIAESLGINFKDRKGGKP